MLRPPAVASYLPYVEEVAVELVDYVRRNRQPDTKEMHGFKKLMSKWSLECESDLLRVFLSLVVIASVYFQRLEG